MRCEPSAAYCSNNEVIFARFHSGRLDQLNTGVCAKQTAGELTGVQLLEKKLTFIIYAHFCQIQIGIQRAYRIYAGCISIYILLVVFNNSYLKRELFTAFVTAKIGANHLSFSDYIIGI